MHIVSSITLNDGKNVDDPRLQLEDGEEEEEVEVEKVVKEEVEIKNVDMEVVEEVLEVDKKEAEPPTTNEKLLSLVDQPKELKTINLLDLSNDMYPEKIDT